MATRTKGLLAAVALLAILVAAPAAAPTASLRLTLEQQLSEALGCPVRIGKMRFALLPRPGLVIEDLTDADGQWQVGRIQAVPVVRSLWGERLVIDRLDIRDLRASLEAIGALLRHKPAGGPAATIRSVRLDDAILRAGSMALPDIDADILLGADGRLRSIHASMDGERVRLEILPTSSGALQLALQARDWIVPGTPGPRLDMVDATALLETHRLEAWNVQARVQQGSAFGFLSARWHPEWAITGEFSLRDVPLSRVLAGGAAVAPVEGRLQATPRFVMRARRAEHLPSRLELASDFVVRDAVLRRVDLHALGSSARKPRGAVRETRFERVSGHLTVRRGRTHVLGLEADSGALAATGNVFIGPDRVLDGRMDIQVARSAGLLSLPLRVSGTLDDPKLTPTTGSVAGAAIGSALLPGVGTALGAKAGQFAEDFLARLRARPAGALRDPERQR